MGSNPIGDVTFSGSWQTWLADIRRKSERPAPSRAAGLWFVEELERALVFGGLAVDEAGEHAEMQVQQGARRPIGVPPFSVTVCPRPLGSLIDLS